MQLKYLITGGIVGLVSLSLVSAAVPPRPRPDDSVAARSAKLDARIKYWLEQIRTAKDGKAIDEVRKALAMDHRAAELDGYAYTFALRAGELACPLLTGGIPKGDPLKALKEINVALVISRLPQVAIQPALEVIVKHPNTAVRYSGWRGYQNIRPRLLVHAERTKTMFKSLDKAADETCPAVLVVVFEMLHFPTVWPPSVSAPAYKQAQEAAYAIFHRVWSKRCTQVLDGDTEMAHVCGKAVAGVVRLDASLGRDDKKKRQRLRQMLIDVTWCAGSAYDRAYQAARAAEAAAKAARAAAAAAAGAAAGPAAAVPAGRPAAPFPVGRPAAPVPAGGPAAPVPPAAAAADQQAKAHNRDAAAMATFLRTCEKNLNALERAGRRHTHIQDALTDRKIVNRGTSVRIAVIKWVKPFEKDDVVLPTLSRFKAKPATMKAAGTGAAPVK